MCTAKECNCGWVVARFDVRRAENDALNSGGGWSCTASLAAGGRRELAWRGWAWRLPLLRSARHKCKLPPPPAANSHTKPRNCHSGCRFLRGTQSSCLSDGDTQHSQHTTVPHNPHNHTPNQPPQNSQTAKSSSETNLRAVGPNSQPRPPLASPQLSGASVSR